MLVKGETVLSKFEDVRLLSADGPEPGTLWITDYQIIFRPTNQSPNNSNSSKNDVYLPLGTIARIVDRTKKELLLKLECKDFRSLTFMFSTDQQCHHTHKTLKEKLNAKTYFTKSSKIQSRPFCFSYKEDIPLKDYDGWQVYSAQAEYERLNLTSSPWRYGEFNAGFKICSNHPSSLVMPECFTEEDLARFSKNHSGTHLPSIIWRQPSSSIFLASYFVRQNGLNISGDETWLFSLFNSMGNQQQLLHLVTPLQIKGVKNFYDLDLHGSISSNGSSSIPSSAFMGSSNGSIIMTTSAASLTGPGTGLSGSGTGSGSLSSQIDTGYLLGKILKTRCKVTGFNIETISELSERLCRLQAVCSAAVFEADPYTFVASGGIGSNTSTGSNISTNFGSGSSIGIPSVSTGSSPPGSTSNFAAGNPGLATPNGNISPPVTSGTIRFSANSSIPAQLAASVSSVGSPSPIRHQPGSTIVNGGSSLISSSGGFSSIYSQSTVFQEWLAGIQHILSSAFQVVLKIEKEDSVLFQNSEDRTLLHISSLTLILIDPHYRTLRGFEGLLEREWCSAGFRFQRRHEQVLYHRDKKARGTVECLSPVFLQFLDCVWQLLQQFPRSFQFNEDFLIFIIDSISSGRFGTFLPLSEKERHENDIRRMTLSIWTYVNYHSTISAKFLNQHYRRNEQKIHPFPNHVTFWSGLYLRYSRGKMLRSLQQRLASVQLPNRTAGSEPLPLHYIANLSACQLMYLPSYTFDQCKHAHIEQIFLEKNYLNTVSIELLNLTSLTKIDLSDNLISLITPEYMQLLASKLPDLRGLNLNNNRLGYFPDVELFTNLEYLDLGSNLLNKIPLGLAQLKNLRHFDVSHNQITTMDVRFEKLATLQSLMIGDQMSNVGGLQLPISFPSPFLLPQLTVLNLDKLELTTLPFDTFPTDLPSLTSLSLISNRFEMFPKQLIQMPQLETLYLDSNFISAIPLEIAQLTNIRVLSLGNNQLQSISHTIGQLTSLMDLNLANNHLVNLPPQFGMLTNLERLRLEGNPLKTPKDLITGGIKSLLNFLKDTLAGTLALFRTKLMVIGKDNVGKSTLLRWITTKKKSINKLDELSTDGVEISEWNFSADKVNDKGVKHKIPVEVSTWDFAGQDLYYTTHQFFLTGRSVYLLVWNMALPEEESRLEYWLQMIKSRAPDSPIIIAGTHLDEAIVHKDNINKELWEKYGRRYPNIQSIHFVSIMLHRTLEKLKEELKSTIAGLDYMGAPIPASYIELEKLVKSEHHREPPLMSWSEYSSMASLCNIEPEELKSATKLLHNLGSIFHFEKAGSLENMIILNPQWLTMIMSSIITTKHKLVKEGVLIHSALQYIWRPPFYPPEIHSSLIALLQKFEIIYTLKNWSFAEGLYIKSPDLSNDEQYDKKKLDTFLLTMKLNQTYQNTVDSFTDSDETNLRTHRSNEDLVTVFPEMELETVLSAPILPGTSQLTLEVLDEKASSTKTSSSSSSTSTTTPSLTEVRSGTPSTNKEGTSTSGGMRDSRGSNVDTSSHDPMTESSGSASQGHSFSISTMETSKTTGSWSKTHSYSSFRNSSLVDGKLSTDFSFSPNAKYLSQVSPYPVLEGCSLVPCLLPTIRPLELQETWPRVTSVPQYGRIYQFDFIPTGLFSRLMIRLLHLGESKCFWRTGLLLQFPEENSDSCLVELLTSTREIHVTYRGYAVNNLGLVIATINFLLADCEWKKFNVHVFLPCVHCVEERSYGPFRFPLLMCEQAARNGKPFVLCYGIRPIRIDFLAPDITLVDVQSVVIDFQQIQIKEKVGEGGFAAVYRAEFNNQTVALKQLNFSANPEGIDEAEAIEAFREFRHEVWIMSGLDHENIVRMKGYCLDPCCVVTEFMEYGNLYNFLHKPENELDTRLRLRIALDTAKGCAFLHNCCPKIIHRDLKSPNILLASTQADAPVVAKVSDFGVSQVLLSTTASQPVLNPIWLAPEVLKKEEYTEKADVYSFGIILWELVTRQDLFGEEQFMTRIVARVLAGERPTIPPDCVGEYRTIIESCWLGDPAGRLSFNTCVEMLTRLLQTTSPNSSPSNAINSPSMSSSAKHKKEGRVGGSTLTKQHSTTWRYVPDENDKSRIYFGSNHVKTISVSAVVAENMVDKQFRIANQGQVPIGSEKKPEKKTMTNSPMSVSVESGLLRKSTEISKRVKETLHFRFKSVPTQINNANRIPEVLNNSPPSGHLSIGKAGGKKDPSGSLSVQCLLHVGNTVWSGHSSGVIHIWSAESGELEESLTLHQNKVFSLVMIEDLVFSGSLDSTHSIASWDTKGRSIRTLSNLPVCNLIAVEDQIWAGTPDQSILVISPKELRVKKQIKLEPGSVQCMLSHRGLVWAATDTIITRITSQSHKIVGYSQGHTSQIHSIIGVGTEVWTASSDKTIRIWDCSKGELLKVLEGHGSRVFTLLNENNKYIWSGCWDCSLYIWNAETKVFVKEHKGIHSDALTSLIIVNTEKDSFIWCASWDSSISIWSLQGRGMSNHTRERIVDKDVLPKIDMNET